MDQFLGLVSRTSFLEIWFPPSFSLSLSFSLSFPLLYLAEFPSGAGKLATSTYLPWLLSSVREGAQGGAPSAIQTGADGPT